MESFPSADPHGGNQRPAGRSVHSHEEEPNPHPQYVQLPAAPAANADTSGAVLAALETEVNQIKALLRSLGVMT